MSLICDIGEAEESYRTEDVTIFGCKTRYFRSGSGSPVLFLHGDRGGSVWLDVLQKLSKTHDVIAPHHPGFGESDNPEWFKNVHDLAYFYLDFLNELELKDVHIIGQGIGGWIASEIAIRSIERIKSITLVGSYGIRLKGQELSDVFLWNRDETMEHLFHDGKLAADLLAQPFSDDDMDQYTKDREGAARIGFAPRFLDPHLQKWLHRIRVPVLVAWGRHDRVLPVSYAEHWADNLPDAKVKIFENSGHLPYVEETEEFVDTFENFIGGVNK